MKTQCTSKPQCKQQAINKLYKLGEGKKGQEVMRSTRLGSLFAGAIVAILSYGHYTAAKMMAKAGFPIRTALRLIGNAKVQGYQYRRPNCINFRKSLDFTR